MDACKSSYAAVTLGFVHTRPFSELSLENCPFLISYLCSQPAVMLEDIGVPARRKGAERKC